MIKLDDLAKYFRLSKKMILSTSTKTENNYSFKVYHNKHFSSNKPVNLNFGFVLYLDILGFTNIVNMSQDNSVELGKIINIVEVFKTHNK